MAVYNEADFVMQGREVQDPEIAKDELELYYDVKGKKNGDVHKDKLLDMSGQGKDGELSGFDYDGELSGYVWDSGLVFDGIEDTLRIPKLNGIDANNFTYQLNNNILAFTGDKVKTVKNGNVQIVGRNLLRNTSVNWTELIRPEGNWFYEVGTDYPVEVGETYTFSMIVEKVSDDTVPIHLTLGLGATANTYSYDFPNWSKNYMPFGEKISLTHTITESNVSDEWGTRTYFAFRLRNDQLATTIRFKEVKLEKSSKATDWTPAPEDLIETTELKGNILGDMEDIVDASPGDSQSKDYLKETRTLTNLLIWARELTDEELIHHNRLFLNRFNLLSDKELIRQTLNLSHRGMVGHSLEQNYTINI